MKMRLEKVAETYGMSADYYEQMTGRTYQLSKAIDNGDGTLSVPVIEGGQLIGYCKMEKKTK